MRKQALNKIYELAKNEPSICFIGSDLGHKTLVEMQQSLPSQFYMEGVSEAHLMGMAAGMASQGNVVFINSIASFLLRRSFEQFYLDICCENKHVIVLGNGGGGVYAPLGHTHTIFDDFAITQNFPNLNVFAPCDSIQMQNAIEYASVNPGPYYIRFGKGNEPDLQTSQTLERDHITIYHSHDKVSQNIMFITTGVTAHLAIEVQESLKELNIKSTVIQLNKIKPFPYEVLKMFSEQTEKIVIIEEHYKNGGLGSMFHTHSNKKFLHFHLGTELISHYGSQINILEKQGISSNNIIKHCLDLFEIKSDNH